METSMLLNVVLATIALLGLCLVARLWESLSVEWTRQRIFRLRDELFDDALAGRVSFQAPAYRVLRDRLNGYIRFSHTCSWLSIFVTYFTVKRSSALLEEFNQAEQAWERDLKLVPAEAARRLERIDERASQIMAWHMVIGSPGALVASVSIGIGYLVGRSTAQAIGEIFGHVAEIAAFFSEKALARSASSTH